MTQFQWQQLGENYHKGIMDATVAGSPYLLLAETQDFLARLRG